MTICKISFSDLIQADENTYKITMISSIYLISSIKKHKNEFLAQDEEEIEDFLYKIMEKYDYCDCYELFCDSLAQIERVAIFLREQNAKKKIVIYIPTKQDNSTIDCLDLGIFEDIADEVKAIKYFFNKTFILMGIKQLSKLIKEKCKKGIVVRKFGYYSSHKIAIDASLCIYQFLIAVRSNGANLGFNDSVTSHLIGMFYRTIKMVESGIIPIYVFDGKAPAMKTEELKKRYEKREKASKLLEEAKEIEDKIEMNKQEKRRIKVEEIHNVECKRLLKLMGIPCITAVSESEAYCAYLCKKGYVNGVATEDMDTLCFGSPVLLRNMNAAQSKKLDIEQYNLNEILNELELNMDSFIDLCILMGCDYCDTIKNVGYKRAYDYIKKHGCIEDILKNEKLEVPENFNYQEARKIFKELSEIGEPGNFQIEYDCIDQNGLIEFLCKEKNFDEERVVKGIEKIINSKNKKSQKRISDFFTKK